MKNCFKLLLALSMVFVFLGCEEDVDYGADLINTYILESLEYMGETYDLSNLPVEEAMFIEITADDVITYENSEDVCEDTYETETDGIDGVTESAILFSDGSEVEYSFVGGKLHLDDGGDVIILAEYSDQVPPPVWTDPTQTENDTYEPDNLMATATNIAAGGTTQNHYMGACDDIDYFMFSATSGTTYIMETTTNSDPDLDLTIQLYSAGGVLLDSDDDSGTNWNPALEWTCSQSGDYYFSVEGFWYTDIGNYAVSVVVSQGLLKAPVVPKEKPARIVEEKLRFSDLFSN